MSVHSMWTSARHDLEKREHIKLSCYTKSLVNNTTCMSLGKSYQTKTLCFTSGPNWSCHCSHETAATLPSKTNPVGNELLSHVNPFVCYKPSTWLQATLVEIHFLTIRSKVLANVIELISKGHRSYSDFKICPCDTLSHKLICKIHSLFVILCHINFSQHVSHLRSRKRESVMINKSPCL